VGPAKECGWRCHVRARAMRALRAEVRGHRHWREARARMPSANRAHATRDSGRAVLRARFRSIKA